MIDKKVASEIAFVVVLLLAIIAGGIFYWQDQKISEVVSPELSEIDKQNQKPVQKACTMEAKLCDDGSYVSRTGPNCEFTSCPKNESVQMANPASTYCVEKGGKSDIRTAEDGSQTGYCKFNDGSECEEWAYFRKECGNKAGN